jgi:hypothetical protein
VIPWPKPRHSRKSKRVTLTGTVLGVGVRLSGAPEAFWSLAQRLQSDSAAGLALSHGFVNGIMTAARGAPRRVKRNEIDAIKTTAAAVYLFITERDHGQLPSEGQAALASAEAAFAAAYPTVWRAYGPRQAFERRKFLTAFLVYDRERWTRLHLGNPFTNAESSGASVYKTYVRPTLRAVRASLRTPEARHRFRTGVHSDVRFILERYL